MPARPPPLASSAVAQLLVLGQQIRAHRKSLHISAITAAQAAGMSRVTMHRIEKGEPAVTMGAYLNAMAALGLNFGLVELSDQANTHNPADRVGWIPARIHLADYPQLKLLAWQVHGTENLTPVEALGVYERNWRHVDEPALEPHERHLIDALRLGLGGSGNHV